MNKESNPRKGNPWPEEAPDGLDSDGEMIRNKLGQIAECSSKSACHVMTFRDVRSFLTRTELESDLDHSNMKCSTDIQIYLCFPEGIEISLFIIFSMLISTAAMTINTSL